MRRTKTIAKLLKLKEGRKREVEIQVKKAADRADEEKSKLMRLEKDYNETMRFFDEKNTNGSLTVNNVASYYDFFSGINSRIDEQKRIHEQTRDELRSLKDSLVSAHQDEKMFEILNEKVKKRELKEREVSEQKEADFFMITRHPSKKGFE